MRLFDPEGSFLPATSSLVSGAGATAAPRDSAPASSLASSPETGSGFVGSCFRTPTMPFGTMNSPLTSFSRSSMRSTPNRLEKALHTVKMSAFSQSSASMASGEQPSGAREARRTRFCSTEKPLLHRPKRLPSSSPSLSLSSLRFGCCLERVGVNAATGDFLALDGDLSKLCTKPCNFLKPLRAGTAFGEASGFAALGEALGFKKKERLGSLLFEALSSLVSLLLSFLLLSLPVSVLFSLSERSTEGGVASDSRILASFATGLSVFRRSPPGGGEGSTTGVGGLFLEGGLFLARSVARVSAPAFSCSSSSLESSGSSSLLQRSTTAFAVPVAAAEGLLAATLPSGSVIPPREGHEGESSLNRLSFLEIHPFLSLLTKSPLVDSKECAEPPLVAILPLAWLEGVDVLLLLVLAAVVASRSLPEDFRLLGVVPDFLKSERTDGHSTPDGNALDGTVIVFLAAPSDSFGDDFVFLFVVGTSGENIVALRCVGFVCLLPNKSTFCVSLSPIFCSAICCFDRTTGAFFFLSLFFRSVVWSVLL
mmetsp:Transcript_121901/g.248877  ORF Transcript_121901/g.248877 Transcript_121901/m.248877 type:complete len:538 (+) Transcript_121901:2625-4238(+)